MELATVIEGIERQALMHVVESPADYIGENGLLYCGNCHTAKQYRGSFLGVEKTVPCVCQCRKEQMEAEERARQWEQQQKTIKEYRRMGFPESDMQHWTFTNADGCKIIWAAEKYVENFDRFIQEGKGLLLHGGVGVGKTFAAACVVNALIDKGRPCLMTNFSRILNTLWGIDEKQAYIDSLNKFDLLVLDDLGIERQSEYVQEQVFNVVDSRYRAKLPLIVTTNLPLKELTSPESVGYGRIYDRLLEMCHPVKVEGESRRRQKVAGGYASMNEMLGL